MGIFNLNFDRPGPGAAPDEQRKTGVRRMREVLSRDYGIFIVTGLLALLALVPFVVILGLACRSGSLLLMIAGGIVGGLAAGPALCGAADTVLRSLRDEPGFRWFRYTAAMRRNWKAALLPGAIFGLLFSVELFTLYHLPQINSGLGVLLCQLISMVVCTALLIFSLPQLVLMNLSFGSILKNSLLLSIRYFPKTMCAVLAILIYGGLIIIFLPMTSIILLLTSLWFPLLCSLNILYPLLDENFHVEERLQMQKEANLTSVLSENHKSNEEVIPSDCK